MTSRIASACPYAAGVVLSLVAMSCEALEMQASEPPRGRSALVAAGGENDGVYYFDDKGLVHFIGLGRSVTETVRSAPSVPLGPPIALCSAGNMAAVAYADYIVRLDKLKSDLYCNSHLGTGKPTAIAMTENRLAVVVGRELRVFNPEDFKQQIRLDMTEWLRASETTELRFALPVGDDQVMLVGYKGSGSFFNNEPSKTVIQMHGLARDDKGNWVFNETLEQGDIIPRTALHTCAHEGSTVYLAGRLTSETKDELIVRKQSGAPWVGGEVVRTSWPERNYVNEDRVRLGQVEQMTVGHGLVVLIHQGGYLRSYRESDSEPVVWRIEKESGDATEQDADEPQVMLEDQSGFEAAVILSPTKLEVVQDGQVKTLVR